MWKSQSGQSFSVDDAVSPNYGRIFSLKSVINPERERERESAPSTAGAPSLQSPTTFPKKNHFLETSPENVAKTPEALMLSPVLLRKAFLSQLHHPQIENR
jgi:hypothetical protein